MIKTTRVLPLAVLPILALLALPLQAGEFVKLGLLMDFSGPLSSYSPPLARAAELAVNEINADGGVLKGRELKLITADSQASHNQAVTAANRLIIKDNVVAIVGALASSATMAAAASASAPAKVVMISPASTSPAISSFTDNDFLFRLVPSDAYQGEILAKIALEENIRKVAITFVNNEYGFGIAKAFRLAFEKAGGSVSAYELHEEGAGSYHALLQNLGNGGAEALLLVGYSGGSGGAILRQAIEAKSFARFLAPDGMVDPKLLQELSPGSLDGALFTSPTVPEDNPASQRFETAYAGLYGEAKNQPYLPQTYDAVYLAALALEKAGSTDGIAIRDALRAVANPPGRTVGPGDWKKAKALIAAGEAINYEGAGGPQDFDHNGDIAGYIGKLIVRDNQFVKLATYN